MLLYKRAPSERAGGALCPALSLRAVVVAVLPSGDALGAPLPTALWLRRYRGGLPPAPPAHSGQLASSPMSFFSVLSPIWAVLCAPERLSLATRRSLPERRSGPEYAGSLNWRRSPPDRRSDLLLRSLACRISLSSLICRSPFQHLRGKFPQCRRPVIVELCLTY